MICEGCLLKVLRVPHVSEKTSTATGKFNTIVFKVAKDAAKAETRAVVRELLEIKVEVVSTLVVKGKVKRHRQHTDRRGNWEKAYIILREDQNLDFVDDAK